MPLHVSSTCAHNQEVKIALYRCDDTRSCVMQFLPPDDEHMCSKHVEAWNKLIVKQKFCASSWLITEINILRCTVSKTSKFDTSLYTYICVKYFRMANTKKKDNRGDITACYMPKRQPLSKSLSNAHHNTRIFAWFLIWKSGITR